MELTLDSTDMLSLLSSRLSVPAIYISPSRVRVRVRVSAPLSSSSSKCRVFQNHRSNQMNLSTEASSENNNGVEETQKAEDVIVQYVVLRRDLIDSWPLGSVVTQGCHASVSAIWAHKDDNHTLAYCSPDKIDSMHKVTLEVKGETQLLNLSQKLTSSDIAHKLWVEQPENMPTCLATKPYPKSTVSSFFKKLKLCK